MARDSKLRKKKIGTNTYWFTKAGGETYLGKVEAVPFEEGRQAFREPIGSPGNAEKASKSKALTASELMDLHLE